MTATTTDARGARAAAACGDAASGRRGAGREAQGGGLDDLLRSVLGGQGGGLGDILGKLGQQAGGSGGIADILKQVLGQATSGVKEGAGRIDDATGASRYARDAVGQATGRSPEDVLAQLKELVASNQLGSGAALGGLGALVLGTGTGRSLAGSAIKLGGLALIGGLAYKAYQNYQQGQPLLTGATAAAAGSAGRAGRLGLRACRRQQRPRDAAHPRHDRRSRRRRPHRRAGAEEDPRRTAASRPGGCRAAIPGARDRDPRDGRRSGRCRRPRRRRPCRSIRRPVSPSIPMRRGSTRSLWRWPSGWASTTISPPTSTLPRATRGRERDGRAVADRPHCP